MKTGPLPSFVSAIFTDTHGTSYRRIMAYFLPECITAFLLYSLPVLLDAFFIGSLKSTSTYATLGVTSTMIHFLIKVAEGVSVGTVVLSGVFNGVQEYKNVGRSARDAFWLNTFLGAVFGLMLYTGAQSIYSFYGVSERMVAIGIPYLRMQAVSLFFMFIALSFIGFLRGVKNTRVPMIIFMIGTFIFVLCDYLFIFGYAGFPALGLQGSALASIVRYVVMVICLVLYTFGYPENRKYGIHLFSVFTDKSYIKRLLFLSIPVTLDKATMALAQLWLGKMICSMGTQGAAAFCVVKDMERFAILPAVAFAQVVTLLVSNDYGAHRWDAIQANVKKILLLSSVMVLSILALFALYPEFFIGMFDRKGSFTELAAYAFPFISVLGFFDLLQLILAGALRATGNVNLVMGVRFGIFAGFFIPLSYILAHMPFAHQGFKFVLIYSSFYVGNMFMSLIFIRRLSGQKWKTKTV